MILDRLLGRRGRRREADAQGSPPPPAPAGHPPAGTTPAQGSTQVPVQGPTQTPGRGPGQGRTEPGRTEPGRTEPGPETAPAPLPPGGVVRGTVVTRDGWPLPDATVTALSSHGASAARAASGSDGRFTLTGVPAGSATVLMASPGHEPQARSVTIAPEPTSGSALDLGTVRLVRQDDHALPPPGRWVIDPLHTSIVATAHHLGLSAVRGRLDLAEGLITVAEPFTRSTVEVTLAAASIDTGVAARDDHLRSGDFLDVGQHPFITYRARGLTPTASGAWTLDGQLTLLGESRDVPLELEATGTGQDPWGGTRTAFRATAHLARDDFRMNWNQAVGLGVSVFGTTLRVTIDLEAVLQD